MPVLTILAGPNGAGKTWYSNFLLQKSELLTTPPFNIDLIDKDEIYSKLSGNIYNAQNEIARIKHDLFTQRCETAIREKVDFSYECNLRTDQVQHIKKFEDAGYKLYLVFVFLETVELSHERVKYRVEKHSGNRVDKDSINENFKISLANLDISFEDWDRIVIIDNSSDFKKDVDLSYDLIVQNGTIMHCSKEFPPESVTPLIPEIWKKIVLFKESNEK